MSLIKESDVTLTEKQFRQVSDIIYKHCGINLHDGKKTLVRARLAKRIRECHCKSFAEYIKMATSEQNGNEFTNLVDSISTNLTSFFREKMHFEHMKNKALPALVAARGKQTEPKIRIWSAGCSSGEEPYTIAITVLEELEKTGKKWDIKILATDVSTRILEMAMHGTYDADRVAPLTAQQKQRFLVPNRIEGEKVYQVSNSLKNIIRFRYLNLMDDWPFKGPFDIIFCRNVMIYFDKPTQEKLINRYWNCLEKGGILCIGHSESLTGVNHKYKYIMPATYGKA